MRGIRIALVVLAGSVAGCGGSSSHGWLPAGAVRGTFQGSLPTNVTAKHVYCQWDNGHVDMVITFTNHGYGEQDETVQYLTRYVIAGQNHGDSVDNQESHIIHAGQTITEHDDAGTPSGAPDNAKIEACIPGD